MVIGDMVTMGLGFMGKNGYRGYGGTVVREPRHEHS